MSTDRSMALLRALSTAKDNRAYVIPSSGGDRQIGRGGFVLKGWIESRDPESGLDGKDIWSGGVRFPPHAPADEIVDLMTLETDSDKRVWRDKTQRAVMCFSGVGTTTSKQRQLRHGAWRTASSIPWFYHGHAKEAYSRSDRRSANRKKRAPLALRIPKGR